MKQSMTTQAPPKSPFHPRPATVTVVDIIDVCQALIGAEGG